VGAEAAKAFRKNRRLPVFAFCEGDCILPLANRWHALPLLAKSLNKK
jgi:hypothetical protein